MHHSFWIWITLYISQNTCPVLSTDAITNSAKSHHTMWCIHCLYKVTKHFSIFLFTYTRHKNEMDIGLNNTLPSLILVYLSSPPCDTGPHPILQLRVLGQLNHVQPRFLALCFWINSNCFFKNPHKYKSKGVRSSEQGGQASHIHFPIQFQ